MNEISYFAHTNGVDKSQWQPLYDHLINTASLARQLGADAGVSDFAGIAGLFHDIGKYSKAFQRRLQGAPIKVDHSTAGAQEIEKLLVTNQTQRMLGTLLAYCIAGHHSGLPDYGSPVDVKSESTLRARLKRKVEDYSVYSSEIDASLISIPDHLPIRPEKGKEGFSAAFFTRLVYSALVDADFIDTETFMTSEAKRRGDYPAIETLNEIFAVYLKRFDNPTNEINKKRTETLRHCLEKSAERPGFFTLTIPTGGGKTFASMAFALRHAVAHGLKRVIYVIPFTSIIDQNATEFKNCFGEDNVLEHHSNFDWQQAGRARQDAADDQTNDVIQKLKLASENWDIPVVATTNVQFFESLFANRSSRCRKLHNLAKSVIIFDEAQMLPREFLQPCMTAVLELVKNYGATAVFCTATQPSLDRFMPSGTQFIELAQDSQELFDFYCRVEVKTVGKLPDHKLLEEVKAHSQVLCIVNTRKHAKGLFDSLKKQAADGCFHLSTLMCPAHRKKTLAEIREGLKGNGTCRVVSTQVMEAGIDLDFPVGYRALAGLDSIIQAAGRVNREGKQKASFMYVFEPETPLIKRTPAFVSQGAAVSQSILRDYRSDPISIEAINAYFNRLYALQDDTAFDAKAILTCFNKMSGELNFDFKTAAEHFRLIDNDTRPVIIPYNEAARSLIERLQYTLYASSTLRKLQIYAVNIYEQEFEALQSKGAIQFIADLYAVLDPSKMEEFYNAKTGLIIPETVGGEAVFF